MEAVLLIGHGSKEDTTAEVLKKIAKDLEKSIEKKVFYAFLDFNSPNIGEALNNIYEKGMKKVTVLPYFLFSGIHIKKDIPQILKSFKKSHSDMFIEFAPPIDYHPLMIEILKEKLNRDREIIE